MKDRFEESGVFDSPVSDITLSSVTEVSNGGHLDTIVVSNKN